MSKVLSFRLCRENPREAKALTILSRWREDGYSLRHTLIEAILRLDNDQSQPGTRIIVDDLLETLKSMLQKLPDQISINPSIPEHELSQKFITSLKMSIKPPLKLK